MKGPGELREQARRYRELASKFTDERLLHATTELAQKYEAEAAKMELVQTSAGAEMTDGTPSIRERAYQIWEEQGRPEGLHDHHWRLAELELAEADGNKGEGRYTGGDRPEPGGEQL
jgi:Protein of unknown function (DUF2934)